MHEPDSNAFNPIAEQFKNDRSKYKFIIIELHTIVATNAWAPWIMKYILRKYQKYLQLSRSVGVTQQLDVACPDHGQK